MKEHPQQDEFKKSYKNLAWVLDSWIQIPGTKITIGLDSILGLIPGLGDTATTLLSIVIFQSALKYKLPRSLQIHMLSNILIDYLIGLIPGIGDIADIFWKSNQKNIQLIEDYLRSPTQQKGSSTKHNILFFLLLFLVITVFLSSVALGFYLLAKLVGEVF